MNKIFTKLSVLVFAVSFAAGCSTIEQFQGSNVNVEDKTRETLGLKKTGIAECDEVIEILTRKSSGDANAGEESWTNKAMTELIKQQIYNYVNDGASKTPKEKEDLTLKCKTALGYLKEEPKK